MRPKIYDDDVSGITVQVNHGVVQSWVYANEDDRREKMRQAHYFCDGYMCALGSPLKQVGMDN